MIDSFLGATYPAFSESVNITVSQKPTVHQKTIGIFKKIFCEKAGKYRVF